MVTRMKLTYPPSHKTSDLVALFDEYTSLRPDLSQQWLEIEKKGRDLKPGDLDQVGRDVEGFLATKVDFNNRIALTYGFLTFRKILVRRFLGYDLVPGDDE